MPTCNRTLPVNFWVVYKWGIPTHHFSTFEKWVKIFPSVAGESPFSWWGDVSLRLSHFREFDGKFQHTISAHFQKWPKIFQTASLINCRRGITRQKISEHSRTFFKFQTFQISLATWAARCQHKNYFQFGWLLGISGMCGGIPHHYACDRWETTCQLPCLLLKPHIFTQF